MPSSLTITLPPEPDQIVPIVGTSPLIVHKFSEKSKRLDAMPLADRGRFAIAEIERLRPATRGMLEFVGAHSWEQSPYERGCSFQMVPGRALAWARSMAKPHQSLHFAGEHLRQLEVGMEAAMESGERAAREVAERMAA